MSNRERASEPRASRGGLTRRVELGHDAHAARRGVGRDGGHVAERVALARRPAVGPELRVGLALERPRLPVDDVPVQDVQLGEAERVDDALDRVQAEPVAVRVDEDAAPRELGRVRHGERRALDGVLARVEVVAHGLRERLQRHHGAVDGLGRDGGGAAVRGPGQRVALVHAELQRHVDVRHVDVHLRRGARGRRRHGRRAEEVVADARRVGGEVRARRGHREGQRGRDGLRAGAEGDRDGQREEGDGRRGRRRRRLGLRARRVLDVEVVAVRRLVGDRLLEPPVRVEGDARIVRRARRRELGDGARVRAGQLADVLGLGVRVRVVPPVVAVDLGEGVGVGEGSGAAR